MIDLSDAHLLGKGSSRECYVHPEDDSKCVKVTYSANRGITREEMKHYRRYLRRGISWDMMARAYGFVSTSRGVGAVFSLARDFNGEISGSLDFYLQKAHETMISERELRSSMAVFRSYLQRERIIVRELKADNLIYQRLGPATGRLILIDGVGNNEFLPVANYSVLFARRSLKKRWKKFEDSLLSSYPDNHVLRRVVENLQR